MTDKAALPNVFTPEQIAQHFGWSPRELRKRAREIGACRIMGNRMVLTDEDLVKLLEATKPAPTQPPPRQIDDYALLLKQRKKQTPKRR